MPNYLAALQTACERSQAGERNAQVFEDDHATVSVNEQGGVEIAVHNKQLFEVLKEAAMGLAYRGSVACASPIFGPSVITFRPRQ